MCNVCCREFRGWCKSFTKTETLLCVLEGVLLVVFIGFLIFLLLHLLACSKQDIPCNTNSTTIEVQNFSQETSSCYPYASETPFDIDGIINGSDMTTGYYKITNYTSAVNNVTISPDLHCSWTPSVQTKATAHYYEYNTHVTYWSAFSHEININEEKSAITDSWFGVEESDGEEADPLFKKFIMALVKLRPMKDIVFGCTLTIISKYWTLTAASCIESIEEVDSLDSFIIMENYGGPDDGVTHALVDIQIHPFYQGTNRIYDLAALKSSDSLVARDGDTVALPQQIQYALVTPGERFTILGYGNFRSINQAGGEHRLRAVHVFSVGGGACGGGGGAAGWAARHLWRGRGAARGTCALRRALCAGVLYARGVPCNYCAGTPLLGGRRLLAVMAAADQCGVGCEPALYAGVAGARPWLDTLLHSEQ